MTAASDPVSVTIGAITGSRKIYRELARCVPKFCSMRVTHDIRDAMAEKPKEFADGGNRVYLPLST